MSKNIFETLMGALVIFVAVGFVTIAYKSGSVASADGYNLIAKFDRIDGLGVGSDVRVSGLKVGSVIENKIDPNTYQAIVKVNVDEKVKLPKDSSAEIVSDGLLGGKYLSLVPGGDTRMLKSGEEIQFTQSSVNIEAMIGKFMFGSTDEKEEDKKEEDIF